ncbi:hypothetical protein [Xanthobacter wiegelii]|uniref:hypothetical protein n=1 Tax=Xanthobacter wiegelii TaxID=3119913 RepID=UPI00372A0C49
MKLSANFHNATFAAVILAALGPAPALAQRGVEFGYKDRIFEQNFLLPDHMNALQAQQINVTLTLRRATGLGLFDSRLIRAAGGICARAWFMSLPDPDLTAPVHATLARMPPAKVDGDAAPDDPGTLMNQPATQDDMCVAQFLLFERAWQDPASMEQQLTGLAKNMRTRFAAEWLSDRDAMDPHMVMAGTRLKAIFIRTLRLQRLGLDVMPDEVGSGQKTGRPLRSIILQGRDDAFYDRLNAQLTEVEEETANAFLKAEREKAGAAKQDVSRHEQGLAQDMERARLAQEERDRLAREEADREQAVRAAGRKQQLAAVSPAEAPPQVPSQPPMPSRGQAPADTARLAEISRLEARLAEIDRSIASLKGQLTQRQQSMLRNPLNPQAMVAGLAGMGQLQGALDQAEAERLEVARSLNRLRKAAAASSMAPASNASSSVPASDDCQQGRTCRVIKVTLFCRTPQQMAAILSQRPGPARRQMLAAFTASGDCRKVGPGATLAWTAPIAKIQPQGEAEAELVPGALADGAAGFMLKDGVIAPTASAAR